MLTFFHKTQQKKLVIILGSAFNEYSEGLHFIDELAHNSEVDVISIDKISLPEDSLHTTKKNVNLKRISINIDSKDTVIKLLSSNRIEANNYDKIIRHRQLNVVEL